MVGEWKSDAIPTTSLGKIVLFLSLRNDFSIRLNYVPVGRSSAKDNPLTCYGTWKNTGPTSAVGTIRILNQDTKFNFELVEPSTLSVVSNGDVVKMKRNNGRTTKKSTVPKKARFFQKNQSH